MELNKFEELGAKVFVYGSTNSFHGGGQINDMEAFIVVKGRIGVKAPKLVEKVSFKQICDSYEDIIWEKTERGDKIRKKVDQIIENNLKMPEK